MITLYTLVNMLLLHLQVPGYSISKLRNRQLTFAKWIMIIYLGMTLSPMFLTLIQQNHENTVFDLLYVAWSPFGIKTTNQFVISFMMQWITTIPVYTAFVSKTVFINFFKHEFRYQCDRLRKALRSIGERIPLDKKVILENVEGDSIQRFVKCEENEFLKKLAECEAHYRQIRRYRAL